MKKFIERNMFWITIILAIPIMLAVNHLHFGKGSWNLNRTVGWGWDTNFYLEWLSTNLWIHTPLFAVGYGILLLAKRKTNLVLSLLHLLLIIISFRFTSSDLILSIALVVAGWVVFLLNVFKSSKTVQLEHNESQAR